MIAANLSVEFLKRLRAMPSWFEVAFGYEHQLLPSNTVIDYAMHKIAIADEPEADELAVASSSASDSIAELVGKLATKNGAENKDSLNLFWANVLLAWTYEHRDQFDDFLGVVEEIYSDFSYPEELAVFVRYMPSDAPDLGSVEANEQRMLASIEEYVKRHVVQEQRSFK